MTRLKEKWMENAEKENVSTAKDKKGDDQNVTKENQQRKSSSSSQTRRTESASLPKDDQSTGTEQEGVTQEKPKSRKPSDENVTANLLNILKKEMLTENDPSKSQQEMTATSLAKKLPQGALATPTSVTPVKTTTAGKQQRSRTVSADSTGKKATASPAKNLPTLAATTTAKGDHNFISSRFIDLLNITSSSS